MFLDCYENIIIKVKRQIEVAVDLLSYEQYPDKFDNILHIQYFIITVV